MKKLFLVLFALVLVAGANAQVKFGPKVGLNLSRITGDGPDAKMLPGFSIGAVAEIDFTSNFYLQPGLQFATKGSKYKDAGDSKTKLTYIEVPVNVGYKINVGPANILAYAGPYLAYGVGGKTKLDLDGISVSNDIEWGSDDNEKNPFDAGLNIGVGLEIDKLQLGLQYGFGLANLSNESDYTEKNGVLSVTASYYIF